MPETASTETPLARLCGASPVMTALRAQLQHLVRFDTLGNPAVPTLLLLGETGTGKSLVARVVHDSGPRAAGPFLAVNCAALPDAMLEAELFGFEAGAFTDAKRAKPGLFEAAAGGTLFLDEIDAVPLALQGKLLTALETKRVRRLGALTERQVDVKLIAATKTELGPRVASGHIRDDLYHRLAVVVLTLPPLRARGTDVVELAEAYVVQLAAAYRLPPKRLRADAVQWLQDYAWPGNVRELRHLLERVTLLHAEETVAAATLAYWCQAMPGVAPAPVSLPPGAGALAAERGTTPPATLPGEAGQIQQALRHTMGNVVQAARLLGLSRDQLRSRMRRYALQREAPPSPADAIPTGQAVSAPHPPPATLPPVGPAWPVLSTPPDETSPLPRQADPPLAERRHLTVLYADLVDMAGLACQRDPEAWQELLQRYHATCLAVMAPAEGYVSQYLGNAVLVCFGYPQAHEDDAQRAVRAALALREAVQAQLAPLQVRIGIHTGVVVINAGGLAGSHAPLALGETPHVAACVQNLATPGNIVCSETTARLVAGYVHVEALGAQRLHGLATPLPLYHVTGRSAAQSRLEATAGQRRTPFVGRTTEMALLQERWAQVQQGHGQVVLLSGEAGIGKSRLVHVMREQVVGGAATHLVCQGSPSQHHSPFAPLLALWHSVLGIAPADPPEAQLDALTRMLASLPLPLHESVPLLASWLSLPLSVPYPPLTLSPEQQKRRTLDTLVLWLAQEAERQPTLLVVEDLHWIDPSTREWLTLVLDQVPSLRLYVLLTCRPEWGVPWSACPSLTTLPLHRLPQPDVERMLLGITSGKPLPVEVRQQVVRQTDGVPLFVEELAKAVLEADWLQEQAEGYALTASLQTLPIPTTLQDSLMARLDRLGSAKAVAQLGATIGRQFAYGVLQAVAPGEDAALQQDVARLVAGDLLQQRGVPPHATYRFKHALIQEAAYQSLLKRTRQQYHQQIAQVLAQQFPALVATQPELLAQHYTAAEQPEAALPYWQQASQRAMQRSAYAEAIVHLTQGLHVLLTLPETPARQQTEVDLQVALGFACGVTRGFAAPEVSQAYARARELCQHLADTPKLFQVLRGLMVYALLRGKAQEAVQLGEQLLGLAQAQSALGPQILARVHVGQALFIGGQPAVARLHHAQALALYTSQAHQALALDDDGIALGVLVHSYLSWDLWSLGLPQQARQHSQAACTLAQEMAQPYSLAFALFSAAITQQWCRAVPAAQTQVARLGALAAEQGFPLLLAWHALLQGWLLASQGQREEGIAMIRQGLAAEAATGSMALQPYGLGLLAEAYGADGQPDMGLAVLAEARAVLEKTDIGFYTAEIFRLQGVLLLQQVPPDVSQAEACLQHALTVARQQQAKSWELRAAMSLAHLWQQHGQGQAARQLLGEVHTWFTEGLDTADLQDASALLASLALKGHAYS